MADSDATSPAAPTPAVQQIVNPSSPVPTATASVGFVGALVGLICMGLAHVGWSVPASGVSCMMVVLTPVVHVLALRFGFIATKGTST